MFISDRDLEIVTRTVFGESRNEPLEGQMAVAWVIRNRAEAKYMGQDPSEVCLFPLQFSCWNADKAHMPNRVRLMTASMNEVPMQKAMYAVLSVFGGHVPDMTFGAKHYFADYIPWPKWAVGHEPSLIVGRHIFFNTVK